MVTAFQSARRALAFVVVEDQPEHYVLLEHQLRMLYGAAVDVRWAKTFGDGVDELDRADYDVALIDYRLGAHTGFELVEHVRHNDVNVPLIILTSQRDPDLALRALRCGATDFLDKDLSFDNEFGQRLLDHAISLAIERAELQFRDLFDSGPDPVLVFDGRGVIQLVNARAEQMFGKRRLDMIGHSIDRFLTGSLIDLFDDAREAEPFDPHRMPAETLDADAVTTGGVVPVEIALGTHRTEAGALIVATVRDISGRVMFERALDNAAVTERYRIGEELHDGFGQKLAALGLMCKRLEQKSEQATPLVLKLVRDMADLVKDMHADVRSLASGLCPAQVGSQGFHVAVLDLADKTTKRFGVPCLVYCDESFGVHDEHTATNLFLIVQEAVHNAMKHSGGTHVIVRLKRDSDGLHAWIEDDGVGLSRFPVGSRGMGLRTINHRAMVIGASVEFMSRPGSGLTIVCSVPDTQSASKVASGV